MNHSKSIDTDNLVATKTDTICRGFDEDTREEESFGCALLDTMMSDVPLIFRRIVRVNYRKLFDGNMSEDGL
jgi:hypothetical protein